MIVANLKGLSSDNDVWYKLENNQQYIIGRNPYFNKEENNGVKICRLLDADETVSRNHFNIVVDDKGDIKIMDQSRNGTYLQRSNNPIVMINKLEEIRIFENDIVILGGPEYKLKIEYDKFKCKSCHKEIPVVSLYCSFCGTDCNYKNGLYDDLDETIYSEALAETEDDISYNNDDDDGNQTITQTSETQIFKKKISIDNPSQTNKNKRQKKEIREIQCINCSNAYLDTQSFCSQCGYQNCNKRVYLHCVNDDCEIAFRDKFARCPNPKCSKDNPQTREETKNGRPPHNMCKEDNEVYLDSGNNSNVLDILMDKYNAPLAINIENRKSKKDAIYQRIRQRSLNREQIRDQILNKKGVKLELNGIKHICDNLWNLGLISDIYISGTDPNKVSEDNRARVFYIITSDRDRFKKKLDEELQTLYEKLKTMKEKRRRWAI